MDDPIPIGSMFLGPKSENASFLLRTITKYLEDHIYWRRNFHPEDDPAISARESSIEYTDIHAEISQQLFRLTSSLKQSVPSFSPRYLGHMTSDIMIPGILGYMVTMLYNPNNVSWEGSPVTSKLELEVSDQLAELMGYAKKGQASNTWGHITSGGTVANLEALWVAQNIKFHALAIRNAARELGINGLKIGDKTADELSLWEAMNIPIAETLELKERLYKAVAEKMGVELTAQIVHQKVDQTVKRYSLQSLGIRKLAQICRNEGGLPQTVIIIPQTKHYSWMKGPEIFAIGTDQVIEVPVNKYYRQDIKRYYEILEDLREKHISPIMSVAVCGTTEEGAVDQIRNLVDIRNEMGKKGLSYLLHCHESIYFKSNS